MKTGKKRVDSIPVEESVYKRVLKCGDEPVLTLTIRLPKLTGETAAVRRIARCYRRLSDVWRARWEGTLYQSACAAQTEASAASRPFRPWEAQLGYTVTYHEKGLLSLYLDAYEYTGGAHGVTTRFADTWDLRTGFPRLLPSFFPPKTRWRQVVLTAVREQVNVLLATGESAFFDDWGTSAAADLDPCNFYLTEEGVVVFYQLYTLAPYVEGILSFLAVRWETAKMT